MTFCLSTCSHRTVTQCFPQNKHGTMSTLQKLEPCMQCTGDFLLLCLSIRFSRVKLISSPIENGICQTIAEEMQARRTGLKNVSLLFDVRFLGDLRWVARFGLMSQISASQIEAPIGSLFQKYVSSTFIVKMRIDLGS